MPAARSQKRDGSILEEVWHSIATPLPSRSPTSTKETAVPVQPNPSLMRAFVSLSELAEDVLNLSRARVYELIQRGAMPTPIYDVRTRRPMFNAELIQQARTVRQTGIGIDGSAVIFYRRDRTPPANTQTTSARAPRRTSTSQMNRYADLLSSLQGLGIAHADERRVGEAVAHCFPNGIADQQEADVLRAVFRHLRRRQSA
jgi:hypothetical protein